MTDAILFDLDCTLTDRPASVRRFATAFVATYGDALNGPPAVHPGLVVDTITAADANGYAPRPAVCAALAERLPWRSSPPTDLLAFWRATFPDCAVAAADAEPTLHALRSLGLCLGLVTNGAADTQRRKLRAIGLADAFDAVVISAEVNRRKPDAAIFHLAVARLGTSPDRAWFVGDHPVIDVDGARRAGLTAVWLAGVHRWPDTLLQPSQRAVTLPELPPLVRAAIRGVTGKETSASPSLKVRILPRGRVG